MAGLAIRHFATSGFVGNRDPAIIGLDRDLALGLACVAAGLGLLLRRARSWVAVSLLLGISYAVSTRRLAGTLGIDALVFVPIAFAALCIWWPSLISAPRADD